MTLEELTTIFHDGKPCEYRHKGEMNLPRQPAWISVYIQETPFPVGMPVEVVPVTKPPWTNEESIVVDDLNRLRSKPNASS